MCSLVNSIIKWFEVYQLDIWCIISSTSLLDPHSSTSYLGYDFASWTTTREGSSCICEASCGMIVYLTYLNWCKKPKKKNAYYGTSMLTFFFYNFCSIYNHVVHITQLILWNTYYLRHPSLILFELPARTRLLITLKNFKNFSWSRI